MATSQVTQAPPLLDGVVDELAKALAQAAAICVAARDHLVAGAIGRGVSIFAVHPLDTVKTRVQAATTTTTTATAARSFFAPLSAALARGDLYRGVVSTLVGQVPYGMLVFGAFEAYKQALRDSAPWLGGRWRTVAAASMADATGSLWLAPFELIKQQVQNGAHGNGIAAVRGLTRDHGPRGLYQGYGGQLMRDVPFRAAMLLTYEELRTAYACARGRGAEPNPVFSSLENGMLGVATGAISSFVTNPLDIVKTRLMTQPHGRPRVYKNFADCAVKIVRREGPQGLFRGSLPRVMVSAPGVAIFFVVYEATLRALRLRAAERRV